ncbi:Protein INAPERTURATE POLLEN1 [Bienertia sinuspersici]
MIKALFNRFKNSRPFKDFYNDWINTLKSTLLPLISNLLSSSSSDPLILATQIDLLHTHFNSYFSALDRASNADVSQLLFPEWRNSLERPFLWFGDFHPYIFTNLLRSFLDNDDSDENDDGQKMELLGKSWNVWKNPDNSLGHFVDQVECGLRLMVPSIVARARDAQASVVEKLAIGWKEKGENFEVGEAVQELVDEMTSVFLDANRLRRSVLSDIMGALNVYQAAFFLEGLAQFYVGFSDPKLFPQF